MRKNITASCAFNVLNNDKQHNDGVCKYYVG